MIRTTGMALLLALSMVFIGSYSMQSQAEGLLEGDLLEAELLDDESDDDYQSEFQNLDDRFSYAYGVDMAEKLRLEGIELDPDLFAAAVMDVYSGRETRLSAEEIAATIELYVELYDQRKAEERAILGERNKVEGPAFLAANARQEGVVVTESGLQYRIITEGTGDYRPTEDDEVTVHYQGRLIDGTPFDSTYERGQPYTAKVRQLIEGWSEALQLMTVGAEWELFIPAELAFGEEGSQFVAPNAVLIFEMVLLDIEKYDPTQYEMEIYESEHD